jgi:DNA-directed RNA polymerase beta' subunit
MAFKAISYTDEQLLKFSKGRVSNALDLNLKYNNITTVRGGLYDKAIFGSSKYCECGNILRKGAVCPECQIKIISEEEVSKRFGHFLLKYPYINSLDIPKVSDLIRKTLPFPYEMYDKNGKAHRTLSKTTNLVKLLTEINSFQYEVFSAVESPYTYNGKLAEIKISPLTDDRPFSDFIHGIVGLENLLKGLGSTDQIMNDMITELRGMLHHVLLIAPTTNRPYSVRNDGVKKLLQIPDLTYKYKAVIVSNDAVNQKISKSTSIVDNLGYIMLLNKLIDCIFSESSILSSSKYSFVRNNVKSRISKSGRATITSSIDLPVTEIGIPRKLMYHALQNDIFKELTRLGANNPKEEYMKATDLAMQALDNVNEHTTAMLCRNPTLHKFNLTAFKVKIIDSETILLPVAVCESFNADFDGDQMAFYLNTDPIMSVQLMQEMSAEAHWFYTKNREPVYAPKAEILLGIGEASKVEKVSPDYKLTGYDSLKELEDAYHRDEVKVTEQVLCKDEKGNDVQSTYGRLKLTNILGFNIDDLISQDEIICAKNINKIMSLLMGQTNKSQRLLAMQQFGIEVLRRLGITTVTLEELYQTTDKYKLIFNAILKSNLTDEEKRQKLQFELEKQLPNMVNDLPRQELKHKMDANKKLKLSKFSELILPAITVDNEGNVDISYSTHADGRNTKIYVEDCISNRNILTYKQQLTPIGGYNARQLATLGMKLHFYARDNEKNNEGILVPMDFDATGREVLNTPSPVPGYKYLRSCVFNKEDAVYKNEINTDILLATRDSGSNELYLMDNTVIGIDYMTAFGEGITQAALGLKHGGQEFTYSQECTKAQEDLTFKEAGKEFICLTNNDGKEIYYKLPERWFKSTDLEKTGRVKAGDPIFYINKKVHIANTLSCISEFLKVQVAGGQSLIKPKYADCYSVSEGKIHYDKDKVVIGDTEYKYEPNEIYFYSEGTKIKPFTRICSGLMNTVRYYGLLGKNQTLTYILFRDQIHTIMGKSINDDVIEILYKLIKDFDFSVRRANSNKISFIESIYKGEGKSVMKEFLLNDLTFDSDTGIVQQILFRSGIPSTDELINGK